MIEREVVREPLKIVLAVDPHDDHCKGQHDIVIVATKHHGIEGPFVHVTYFWKASAFLSTRGTAEFMDGIAYALRRGLAIAAELEGFTDDSKGER